MNLGYYEDITTSQKMGTKDLSYVVKRRNVQ